MGDLGPYSSLCAPNGRASNTVRLSLGVKSPLPSSAEKHFNVLLTRRRRRLGVIGWCLKVQAKNQKLVDRMIDGERRLFSLPSDSRPTAFPLIGHQILTGK